MREIVGAEGEEFGFLSDLVRDQSRARQLDHGADHVVDLHTLFFEHFVRHSPYDRALVRHFFESGDERNHDLGKHLDALFCAIDSGLENSSRLHLGYFRIGDAEAAAAVAEHRIELVQLLHTGQQRRK